jgi:uncharacterized protein YjiS (DUF1127 family)
MSKLDDKEIAAELELLGQMLGDLGNDRKLGKLCITAADRLRKLLRWQLDLFQDRCENAYVETSLLDEARRIIHELRPDHPFLARPIGSYGVWAAQRREIDELRERAAKLEKVADRLLTDL